MNMKFKRIISTLTIFLCCSFIFAKEYSEDEAKKIRAAVVANVKTYIGCPYRTGGIGPDTFDCSGLIYTVFSDAADIQMPRSVKAIYAAATIVSAEELEEGDLVFFKTTGDGSISHVGIYIGRNQFIHAASDGSNTGVIVSSLNEKYYKNCYAAVGKPFTTKKKQNSQNQSNSQKQNQSNSQKKTQSSEQQSSFPASQSSSAASKSSFVSNLEVDSTLYCDWNLWLEKFFNANFRGMALTGAIRYTPWKVKPALGSSLKWNQGNKIFQIPFFLQLKFGDYLYIYGGPVMNFGHARIPGTENKIETDFWSGHFAVGVSSPRIEIGKIQLSFVQEVLYNFYTTSHGTPIDFGKSINMGLTFNTGITVTLPLKNVLK